MIFSFVLLRISNILLIIDSTYRSALSEGVLRLQEQGKLTAMKTKWWKEKRGGGACSVSRQF